MNCLERLGDGIISSEEDMEALSQKKAAKLLVVSDSHGMASVLKRAILAYGENSDALVFAGDGVADVVAFLNSCGEDVSLSRYLPPVVAFVRGNNDASTFPCRFSHISKTASLGDGEVIGNDLPATDGVFSTDMPAVSFIKAPKKVVFKAAGKTIFVSHGHEHGVYYSTAGIEQAALEHSADIAIFGHTHFPFEGLHSVYVMNPGSLSYPRNHSKTGFAFLNVTEKESYAVFF